MPARADLADRIQCQRRDVHRDGLEERRDHLQQIGVENHLLERGLQAPFHPAGPVLEDVHPAHDRAPQRKHGLVCRLSIHRIGCTHVGRAVGQAITSGKLAAGQGRLHVFRRAEGRRAGLHVDVRGEAAIDEGRAGARRLAQHQPGQRLGILLRQRTGQRHRRHRPGERERRQHHNLVAPGHLDDAAAHRIVDLQRRIGVDDRQQAGLAIQCRIVDAAGDARDLDAVANALAPQRVGVEYLVGHRHDIRQAFEVTDRRMDIERLDSITAAQVDDVERLDKLYEIPEIGPVTGTPAAVHVGRIGRAGDRAKCHPVAPDRQRPVRVAGMQRELLRRTAHHAFDQAALEPDPVAARFDIGAGGAQDRPGFLAQDVEPDLLENRERRFVNLLDRVRRKRLDRAVGVARLFPRQLRDGIDATGAAPSAGMPTMRGVAVCASATCPAAACRVARMVHPSPPVRR